MPQIISLDDLDTWSEPVHRFASDTAHRLDGSTIYTNDLEIDPEEEDLFRSTALTGHLLLAYHCTRLLDHEQEHIRTHGLRRLTRELVDGRINLATSTGAITQEEAASLRNGHVFALGQEAYREEQICLFASRRTLDDRANWLWRLLATWGGEGIYFTGMNKLHEARLRTLGTPSVVVAAIEMSAGWRTHDAHPGVLNAFTGKLLGFEDYNTGINYKTDIPGSQIIAIWQPGDLEYDQHKNLWDS